jgi:uracil-DNA glycosylase family 4
MDSIRNRPKPLISAPSKMTDPKESEAKLAHKVDHCRACTISSYCNHKVYWRDSRPGELVDILFVGEAPGQSEYALHMPFVGQSGQELNDLIEQSLDPSLRYVVTNAVLCTPFDDESRASIRTPSLPEITECRAHLQNLVALVKPKHIVALGKIAEKSLKKFVPQRAYSEELSFTTLMHPSAILRSTHPDLERARFVLALQAISEAICEQDL